MQSARPALPAGKGPERPRSWIRVPHGARAQSVRTVGIVLEIWNTRGSSG